MLFLSIFVALWGFALDKNDFEEVNFAFDSDVLVDGFPSMLRLADMLANAPEYIVAIEGHCDGVGGDTYNDKLAMKRVEAVKNFLIKYGAKPEQIEVAAQGKRNPKADNSTKEGRFINRRVIFTLYKMVDGRKVEVKADAPISEILRELSKYPIQDKLDSLANKQDAIMDKLAKLDNLEALLGKMNEMEEELATLKARLQSVEDGTQTGLAKLEAIENRPEPEKLTGLSLLSFDMGSTTDGDFTLNVGARYFHRFSPTFAFQTQGELIQYPHRHEFQYDLGVVKRYGLFQMGAFTSFKRVNWDIFDRGGTMAQGSVIAELVFDRVTIGGFATHALMREAVVMEEVMSVNMMKETYLNALDQYGVNYQFALPKDVLIEGNIGFINRGLNYDDKIGGVVRFVGPINDTWSWFVEGAWNETYISDSETSGRIAGGIRYGSWANPTNAADGQVIPVDVPRLRYDVRTRVVRTGNAPPVADAGPDQMFVPEGMIFLDGSRSYDPEGDDITYSWTQIWGPPVTLNSSTIYNPSFWGVAGETYVFHLTVTDSFGDIGTDDVRIVIEMKPPPEILYFNAEEEGIGLGETTMLRWKVLYADNIKIETNGMTWENLENPEGELVIAPSVTTMYTLVATGTEVVTETLTVTVDAVEIKDFHADPSVIGLGEESTLHWEVVNAESVTLDGAAVDAMGTMPVTPSTTTTYTLRAVDAAGTAVTSTAIVTVSPVKIDFFNAAPATIMRGESSTLSWQVVNAASVQITGVGAVQATGTSVVSPMVTTVYTLMAADAGGNVITQNVTVTVNDVTIALFDAEPSRIKLGESATLRWLVQNADTVELDGTDVQAHGETVVAPTQTTTYTLVATGGGETVSAQVTVEVYTVDILFFNADPGTIGPGEVATLSWRVEDADSVSINNGIGSVDAEGSTEVSPAVTTTYTLTATGGDGSVVTADVIVNVAAVEVLYFNGDPNTITPGGIATLSWETANAVSVAIDNGVGSVDVNGTTEVSPLVTTTYTLTATGSNGDTANAQVVITVAQAEIVSFYGDPQIITPGGVATLFWQTANAVSVTIDNGVGDVDAEGNTEVSPAVTTTYTLTATGSNGSSVTAQVVVTVVDAEILFFTATPDTIGPNETATLAWMVTDAVEVEIDNGVGVVDAEGTTVVSPAATTTYTLTATGASGATVTAQVLVNVIYEVAITYFSADPTTLIYGDATTLTWGVMNETSVELTDGTTTWTNPTNPFVTSPVVTTTYTLTAIRDVDSVVDTATAQVLVTVVVPNKPPVAFAGYDRTGGLGTYTVDGTGSFDPDGLTGVSTTDLSFEWTVVQSPIGTDQSIIQSPNDAVTDVLCNLAGTYVIKLVVTDKDGATDVDEIRIRVY
jgi:hypothetical protein